MSLLQISSAFKSFAKRTAIGRPTSSLQTSRHRFYAHQSYGGGEGDPKGESPQSQGSNPSADLEHPGPPPPAVGRGTGGGPTKANEGGHNTQENDSSNGSGSAAPSSGAQPKIHNAASPEQPNDDVRKHNEELGKRDGRSQGKVADEEQQKVGKGYWSGRKISCSVWNAPPGYDGANSTPM